MKSTNQCLVELQHQAQQPRLTAEANIKSDTKNRESMEGTAADEEKYGGISSSRVDDDPMCLISFGNGSTEPLDPEKGIGDVLVDKGTEAPKPHFPPMKARMLTSAGGGLLLAGTASPTLRIIFYPQPFS